MGKINKFKKGNVLFVLLILVILGVPLTVSYMIITEQVPDIQIFPSPEEGADVRVIEIEASQFEFKPNIININLGEKVIFKVTSKDVTHGFYIDGQGGNLPWEDIPIDTPGVIFEEQKGIMVTIPPGSTVFIGAPKNNSHNGNYFTDENEARANPIVFNQPGKFKIRCAITCGPLHPFMIADINVSPDYTLLIFVLITVSFSLGILVYVKKKGREDKILGIDRNIEIDILGRVRILGPMMKRVLQWRGVHK